MITSSSFQVESMVLLPLEPLNSWKKTGPIGPLQDGRSPDPVINGVKSPPFLTSKNKYTSYNWGPTSSNAKDHWTLRTDYFEDPNPAKQVQTLPLEGPRSLGR